MGSVNTVMGPVDAEELGFTLSYEHFGTNAAGRRHTYPEFIDRDGIRAQSIAAMRAAYADGVRTIVEVSAFDLGRGRDALLMREAAPGSGMQIIAATGNHPAAPPRPFGEVAPEVIVIAELYAREIVEGIEGTGIKAGVIKVASDHAALRPHRRWCCGRRRANPDGYNFIPRYVPARLKEPGASDAEIRRIMVANPRRLGGGAWPGRLHSVR